MDTEEPGIDDGYKYKALKGRIDHISINISSHKIILPSGAVGIQVLVGPMFLYDIPCITNLENCILT